MEIHYHYQLLSQSTWKVCFLRYLIDQVFASKYDSHLGQRLLLLLLLFQNARDRDLLSQNGYSGVSASLRRKLTSFSFHLRDATHEGYLKVFNTKFPNSTVENFYQILNAASSREAAKGTIAWTWRRGHGHWSAPCWLWPSWLPQLCIGYGWFP